MTMIPVLDTLHLSHVGYQRQWCIAH